MKIKMKDRILKLSGGFGIAFKLFLVLLVLVLVLTSVTTFFIYESSKTALREELSDHLVDLAKTTALMIDVDKHSQLEADEEDTENYKEIRAALQSVMAANPKIDDIYTMIRSEEENIWLFVVDVYAMTPDIGEEYDISEYPQMQLAFERPIADEEITIDKWGVWLSAYAPIYDEEGTAVAILGMDMDAGNVLAAEKKLKSIIALIFLGALLLSLIVSFTFSSHFTRPLKKLKFGTSRVIKGDLSHRIDIERKDEFGELAAAFNHMTASLQEHIEKLEQSKKKVEEAYQLRENFLKETSHRIITPVSIIGGYTELLLESSNLGDDQKERIRTIRERNEEVQKLVRDALEGNYLEEEEEEGDG